MSLDDHCCVLFEDAVDLWPICADTVAAAERAGFKWLVISKGAPERHPFSKAAIPALSVVAASAFGMSESPVSASNVIGRIRQETESTVAAGYAGLLLLIDMSWLLDAPSGLANQGEFEAALEELMMCSLPLRAECLYQLPMFPEEIVLDAMRTHRMVRTRDGVFENPHFLLPQTFLSRDAAATLQQWLATLRPLKRAARSRQRALPGESSWRAPAVAAIRAGPPANAVEAFAIQQAEPESLTPRWKIRCFGNLRIYRQDGSLVRWGEANGATTKAKTLFAYLLHCGTKRATSEDIADLLWPGAESSNRSLNRLYHTVHCLRIALSPGLRRSRDSPYVLGDNHQYYLSLPEGTWVDVPIFEQFCRRGEMLLKAGRPGEALACFTCAQKLYTGTLLADIPAEYAENTDRDWCWSRRYWLEEIYVKMLSQMSGASRGVGDLKRAIVYAEMALKTEPCFEMAHQELMHIFHQLGRREAIERQYRLCMGALQRREGRAPSADTRILFQRLIS